MAQRDGFKTLYNAVAGVRTMQRVWANTVFSALQSTFCSMILHWCSAIWPLNGMKAPVVQASVRNYGKMHTRACIKTRMRITKGRCWLEETLPNGAWFLSIKFKVRAQIAS